jgi:hypothetical protein
MAGLAALTDQQIHKRFEALRPIPAPSKQAISRPVRKNLVAAGYRWNPRRSHWSIPKNATDDIGHNLRPPTAKQKPGYPGGSRPGTT